MLTIQPVFPANRDHIRLINDLALALETEGLYDVVELICERCFRGRSVFAVTGTESRLEPGTLGVLERLLATATPLASRPEAMRDALCGVLGQVADSPASVA